MGRGLNDVAEEIHASAIEKGFWETDRNDGELIALMHSELSEALEALRIGNPPDKHCPDFTSVEIEMADVIIRLLDTCAARGWDIEQAVQAKMKYNAGRPHKHGKRF